ncbi:MAG: RHS repeat-associated core domain-containing protein [Pyrinomonadaceae bacterium]
MQRIYDRNNNYTDILGITYNGHPATKIVDQLGRSIIIEYGSTTGGDSIYLSGVGNEQLTWTVKWKGISVHKTYYNADDYNGYGSGGGGNPTTLNANLSVVDQIILPQQAGSLAYTFDYNANTASPSYGWGEVSALTLPSGARANYTYRFDGLDGLGSLVVLKDHPTRKDLVYQSEYDGAVTQTTDTWQYQLGDGSIPSFQHDSYGMVTAPDGGVTTESCYNSDDTYNPLKGLSYTTTRPDGSVVERLWQTNAVYGGVGLTPNPYVKTEFTSIRDAAGSLTKTAISDFNYDKNGNLWRVAEYDWVAYGSVPRDANGRPTGVPAGAPLRRVTTNTYYSPTIDAASPWGGYPAYHAPNSPPLRNAIASSEISDGNGQVFARSEFTYDDATTTGNITQRKSWDSTKGGYSNPLNTANSVSITTQYNGSGGPTLTTDARGNQTQFTYDPVGGYSDLYPTQTKVAYGTAVQRTTNLEYDFYTGLVTRSTDTDNNVATATTYDVFGRPTLVKAAEGKSEETRTVTVYSDVNRRVIVRSDLNTLGDGKLVSIQHYDQLGRVRLTRRLEDASTQSETDETTGIKVQTRYQFNGTNSYQLVSNPYRANYSQNAGSEPAMGWTRTKSDNGGRIIEAQTFSGAALPAPWGTNTSGTGAVTTAYDANSTTVTDQQTKQRKSVTDALGRLTSVYEDPAGLNYQTSYLYDALGNLRQVTQDTQQRYFMYDSLSRLVRAKNPEQGVFTATADFPALTDSISGNSQWSMGYTYDENGNLAMKIDARNVVTVYGYDALNRNNTVDYQNTAADPTNALHPDINRYYDNPTAGAYGKGRYWFDYAGGIDSGGQQVEHRAVDFYDALGRPKVMRQMFITGGAWDAGSQVSRTYDLAGHVLTQTYPSGRTVTYTYDQAGRTSSFTGNLGDGSTRTYAQGVTYDAASRPQAEQFGTTTPLYHKQHYNVRGQLYDVRLSTLSWQTDQWDWNRGALLNYYSTAEMNATTNAARALSGSENNENLKRAGTYVPLDSAGTYNEAGASAFAFWQDDYAYDALNRLTSVNEQPYTSASGWGTALAQSYTYDRFGNRTINAAGTTSIAGVSNTVFTVDTSTNRLGVPANQSGTLTYDAAGNQTFNSYSGSAAVRYDYDAENRLTESYNNVGAGQTVSRYVYDSDGRRTRRITGGQETWQLYGFDGELIAEYGAGNTPNAPQKEYGYRGGELLVTAEGTTTTTANDSVWVEDTLPTGAQTSSGGWNEAWSWVSSNPTPASGSVSDQTPVTAGLHQQYFQNATGTLAVNAGDNLVAYVYLDAANIPSEVMLQFNDGGWEHRAYWGANQIEWGVAGTVSRKYLGSLPAGGQWVRLEVPASAVGLEGHTLSGFAFTLYGGRASIDRLGKAAVGGPQWLVADQLGTPRMIADKTGSLVGVKRHDYLPFGEELFAGVGGRTAIQGYVGNVDGNLKKWAQLERDDETGLDYAEARYYASKQGRFTSVDPMLESAESERPQTWNRYTYVLNNPLNFVDPDGLRYVQRTLADGSLQYGWCATDECYNNAIDSKSKGYQGWTAVTFDESKPFSYSAPGIGGERYSTYILNPDGTHGYWQVLTFGRGGVSTDWNAQFAIGGLFKGLMGALGGLMDAVAGGAATEATTQAATQATTQATIHGTQRLAERTFSAADIALTKSGKQFLQRDGATVFLKEVAPGKFNVLVEGQRGVVTALKNVAEKKVAKLAAKYGWHSLLK